MAEDKQAQDAIENVEKPARGENHPAAGPHAKEHLIDREKTPGTGSLPEPESKDADAGPD
jgi:hypothetical protein